MDRISVTGRIVFEPDNFTKKHNLQASWKHIGMVLFDGDITEYYAWFIKKRYNLILNKPLRGGHVSFINDSFNDMSLNGVRSMEEVKTLWGQVKKKWDGREIEIVLDVEPRTDDLHWWLPVSHEHRDELYGVRTELGLGKPFWGLHMTIGYANEKWLPHSKYIHRLIKNKLIK